MKKLKRNEKEIIPIIISTFLLFVVLVMGILINEKNNTMIIDTKENKEILTKYNKLLDNIKNNMEEISNSDPEFNRTYNWNTYKLKLDNDAQSQYNWAITSLTACYLYYRTNDFTNTDFIRKFESYDKISKKKFNEIMLSYDESSNYCYRGFASTFYYVDYEEPYVKPYDDDYDVRELELFVKPIVVNYIEKRNKWYKPKNYNELLNEEYYRVSLLNNLSEYLKIKYEKENQ